MKGCAVRNLRYSFDNSCRSCLKELDDGALVSQSQSESDPSERSLCREPLRYSIDNSVAGSSDDGVPVAPSRFLKMQDGVSPSPNPEGWLEKLIEDWLTLVNRGVLGPLHQSKAATAHAIPSSRPSSFAGEQWFV